MGEVASPTPLLRGIFFTKLSSFIHTTNTAPCLCSNLHASFSWLQLSWGCLHARPQMSVANGVSHAPSGPLMF
ncbi:MAG: hypothetical protein CL829_01430 [Crocinitomicaceae bacterium]|nr:hypothetical protein [Crocinitomicaceae bacterium]